jgi:hypothetical protein
MPKITRRNLIVGTTSAATVVVALPSVAQPRETITVDEFPRPIDQVDGR